MQRTNSTTPPWEKLRFQNRAHCPVLPTKGVFINDVPRLRLTLTGVVLPIAAVACPPFFLQILRLPFVVVARVEARGLLISSGECCSWCKSWSIKRIPLGQCWCNRNQCSGSDYHPVIISFSTNFNNHYYNYVKSCFHFWPANFLYYHPQTKYTSTFLPSSHRNFNLPFCNPIRCKSTWS